jgi:hypothetical protein
LQIKSAVDFIPSVIKNANTSDIRTELQNSLIQRTQGHSKFALSLSGGVDSSILAIECAKMNLPVEAYSLKWTNSDKDRYNIDADIAKKTAKRLGIQFTEVEMPPPSFIPSLLKNEKFQNGDYSSALYETFLEMDVLIQTKEGQKEVQSLMENEETESMAGCTANVCIVTKT